MSVAQRPPTRPLIVSAGSSSRAGSPQLNSGSSTQVPGVGISTGRKGRRYACQCLNVEMLLDEGGGQETLHSPLHASATQRGLGKRKGHHRAMMVQHPRLIQSTFMPAVRSEEDTTMPAHTIDRPNMILLRCLNCGTRLATYQQPSLSSSRQQHHAPDSLVLPAEGMYCHLDESLLTEDEIDAATEDPSYSPCFRVRLNTPHAPSPAYVDMISPPTSLPPSTASTPSRAISPKGSPRIRARPTGSRTDSSGLHSVPNPPILSLGPASTLADHRSPAITPSGLGTRRRSSLTATSGNSAAQTDESTIRDTVRESVRAHKQHTERKIAQLRKEHDDFSRRLDQQADLLERRAGISKGGFGSDAPVAHDSPLMAPDPSESMPFARRRSSDGPANLMDAPAIAMLHRATSANASNLPTPSPLFSPPMSDEAVRLQEAVTATTPLNALTPSSASHTQTSILHSHSGHARSGSSSSIPSRPPFLSSSSSGFLRLNGPSPPAEVEIPDIALSPRSAEAALEDEKESRHVKFVEPDRLSMAATRSRSAEGRKTVTLASLSPRGPLSDLPPTDEDDYDEDEEHEGTGVFEMDEELDEDEDEQDENEGLEEDADELGSTSEEDPKTPGTPSPPTTTASIDDVPASSMSASVSEMAHDHPGARMDAAERLEQERRLRELLGTDTPSHRSSRRWRKGGKRDMVMRAAFADLRDEEPSDSLEEDLSSSYGFATSLPIAISLPSLAGPSPPRDWQYERKTSVPQHESMLVPPLRGRAATSGAAAQSQLATVVESMPPTPTVESRQISFAAVAPIANQRRNVGVSSLSASLANPPTMQRRPPAQEVLQTMEKDAERLPSVAANPHRVVSNGFVPPHLMSKIASRDEDLLSTSIHD
ncbi:uncharacterized protein L969DRAFT_96490 [Mixia osmundae IAM 14324]|uniref:Uncharacterized protein n=1 Tax=Mixia osmundae (strain CBS 9802 / IAM 14324 / JCM 22182 / KY 12970) TaxID=764103 RepID=G7DUW0_MIXOS|nr:uncharacterized protein L969DRAFT_96490 [Mixia osmundae IAM 14324]KEI37413.1 hypothetical protein L969DRAFT_96490 [Mixia osmundae IAM 14324]GAA94370.1 hypothetical protein E5Q_01021 [Mixia osmundae IAM 14324]